MLVSFQQLARKITEQSVSQITRASFNSCVESSHKMESKQCMVSSNGPRDTSYEDAVKALHNLQSNAETIAKARQNVDKKATQNIPNMIRYILRSGLTMEDVDKLSVIHVSGTKGKGSTCAFCERILCFHGYKTGLFTSPHMIEVRERIRINGRPISQELFSKYFWKVYNSLQMTQAEGRVGAEDGGGMPPYFAFVTVLSLHVFLSEGVDVAVVEVGIGGQYDSTNFFRKPVVCGVTSLGLDHTALLGNTIAEIAWNKAGIFKPGRPAITVQHERAALEVVKMRAHEIQNPLFIAKEMSSEFIQRQNIKLGIAGAKQAENASLAIQLYRMWEQLRATGKDVTDCIPTACSSVKEIPQLEVSELDDAILKGLSSCVWPGRAQTINRGDVTYYLDGAHTKESMEVCVQWFEEAAKKEMNHQRGKKFARILLFNATSDRDVGTLLTCLTGCNFDAAVFCTNLLSTMESLNRADQLNKTVTQGFMMEKVDKSKSTWDELIAKSRRDSDVARNSNLYSGNRPLKLCDKTNRIDSRALLDYNFNRAHTGVTKEATHTAEIPHELKRSPVKHFKVPHDTFAESKSDLVCQSTSWVRHISAADQENVLKEKENKNMPIETGKNYAVVQVKCCSGGEQISKPLLNGFHSNHVSSIGCIDSSLSMKFSCILHALTWATQGRDLLLTLNDPDFIVPFTPNELRQADHLQILVTGSLLLVGGVLGVVDPHMND